MMKAREARETYRADRLETKNHNRRMARVRRKGADETYGEEVWSPTKKWKDGS